MLIASAAVLGIHVAASYKVEHIACLTDNESGFIAINDKGEVLGHSTPKEGIGRAFVWKDGKLTELPGLKAGGDGELTGFWLKGIDNKGKVIGTIWRSHDEEWWDAGFEWTKEDGLKQMAADGGTFIPSSISNGGLIAGVVTREDGSQTLGLLNDSKFTRVMAVNSWGYDMEAAAITNDGVIVGTPSYSTEHVAYRIVPGKDMALLSSPVNPAPQDGQTHLPTTVFDINNGGWSVGTIERRRTPGTTELIKDGVVWSPENDFSVIGPYIKPMQINDEGIVVGYRSHARPNRDIEAIIWDRKLGVRDLNSLVPAGSPRLASAVAINNRGEIVCMAPDMKDWWLLRPVGK